MSLFRRLYRGETRFGFIAHRKRWYIASAVILLICVGSMAFRGFNFGIEFAGGNQFLVAAQSGTSLDTVRSAVEGTGVEVSSAQERGQGASRSYVIRAPELSDEQRVAVKQAIADAGRVSTDEVNSSEVSSSWGRSVTQKALVALVVFLVLVAIYLWIRYEQKMATAALLALVHDLALTAGVYSLVGFEVTPGTVIGLLTILGYSLYDTVVVFDKVDENTKGILGHNRYSYGEAANLAVNQTLMRSINTSLIALLPVGGLLFVGTGLLGVGTLKDLALVLFVGMMTGAYSSLFLATPWLVDLKQLDSKYKLHTQRVATRRVALERGEESDRRTARAARLAKAGTSKSSNGTEAAAEPSTPTDTSEPRKPSPSRPAVASGSGSRGGRTSKRKGGRRR
ncbi:MAG: protein translocase subunit SecF [Dactylosporangium sp.]|nr:protein translocase subunit SecF [Dactylosporangium sp.]NNJ60470.1 protein translocase subunit SecF [Dactylosporangium sp.]